MASRIIVRIELTAGAKDRVNAICDRTGMTQVAMLSRLVEWFSDQSDLIQAAVLGHLPTEVESDVAKLILKRMMDRKRN